MAPECPSSPVHPASPREPLSSAPRTAVRIKYASGFFDPLMDSFRQGFMEQRAADVSIRAAPHLIIVTPSAPKYERVLKILRVRETPILTLRPPSASPRRSQTVQMDPNRLMLPSLASPHASQSRIAHDSDCSRSSSPASDFASESNELSPSTRRQGFFKGKKRLLNDEVVEEPPSKRMKRKAVSLRPKLGKRKPLPSPSAGPSAATPLVAANSSQVQGGQKKPWALIRWQEKRRRNETISRRGGKKTSAGEKQITERPKPNKTKNIVKAFSSVFGFKR